MRSSRNIVWGVILLIFGAAWLLRNLGWLQVDWGYILPYWPVLLILAGIIKIFSRPNDAVGRAVVSLLIVFAVIGGFSNKKHWHINSQSWNPGWNQDNMPLYDGNDPEDEESYDRDDRYLNDRKNQNRSPKNGYFSYNMETDIEKATLNLEGGAGSFELDEATDKLFEANTRSSVVNFLSNKAINKLNKTATVSLKMEEGELSFKNGKVSNEAHIKLNTAPIWTVDMGIGAGKGNFDFSKYKVEAINISTGVANLDLRLGDLHDQVKVDIEAGVASIEIEVPRNMGCEVVLDGAMNVKSLKDFIKTDNGHFHTEGFDQSSKKISIKFEGALTKVKVKRY